MPRDSWGFGGFGRGVMSNDAGVTILLGRIADGDARAAGELFPMVYAALRAEAARQMRHERAGHTLQATALVHEVYLKLVGREVIPSFQGRAHFYNAAALAMRNLLVDHARGKSAAKRKVADGKRVDLDGIDVAAPPDAALGAGLDWELLDGALKKLEARDARRYQVVMLKFFAGLGESEIGEVLGVDRKTIQRDWKAAKLFLLAEMKDLADP
jgi:RNA polymerase sigma factor (TIGR02999 family)